MPTKSSSNLGTEPENKTELSMTSRRAKPAKTTPEVTEAATVSATEPTTPVVRSEVVAETVEAIPFEEILADGRERIDAIDDQLLELIVRRMEVAGTLLAEKHSRRMNTRDKARQSEIYARLTQQATELEGNGVKLNKHQIREVFELLVRFGVERHRQNIINRRR